MNTTNDNAGSLPRMVRLRELRRATAALWAIAGGVNSGVPAALCWVVVTVICVDLCAETVFDIWLRMRNLKQPNTTI